MKNFENKKLPQKACENIVLRKIYTNELNVAASDNQQPTTINCFAIDEKINLVAVQIEKMEKFKKGLLREMFV